MIGAAPDAVRIGSADGSVSATVLAFGATLADVVVVDDAGVGTNLVVSLPAAEDFRRRELNPHLGAIAGRFANRIAGGHFTLDGVEHDVERNEGPNCLHGGPIGFSRRDWTVVDRTGEGVTLELVSVDGDQGFPGELRATVRYSLHRSGLHGGPTLHMELAATTDAPTVVSLTNHAYWNLAGGGDVHGHELRVAASRYLPTDDEQIPTGELRSVDATPYDFRTSRPIGATPVDHCLVLDQSSGPAGGPVVETVVAELFDPTSGRRVTLSTSEPGLQVYTGHKLGPPHVPFGGVALEAQRFPDAPNRPAFGDTTLRPGQRYEHVTTLAFS